MKSQIISAYIEIKNLNVGFVYTIAQVNWWLLKYSDLYKNIVNSQNALCDVCLELQAENLPYDCLLKPDYCNKNSKYQSFIKFYDELDKATELNKLEEKCFNVYEEYKFLNCIDEDLRDWVIKHYDVYEKLGVYFFEYLEFNSSDVKNLHIAEAPDKSFGVDIKEEDFISAIRFYDVYHDLYYNQKLYPEKIKEWDEIFSKIQLPKEDL